MINGRSSRAEYWYFILFNAVIIIGLSIIDKILGLTSTTGKGALSGIYQLAISVPLLTVAIRRMHDVNKSGWFMLIPFYNIVLAVTAGDKGDNKYGQAPKTTKTGTTETK